MHRVAQVARLLRREAERDADAAAVVDAAVVEAAAAVVEAAAAVVEAAAAVVDVAVVVEPRELRADLRAQQLVQAPHARGARGRVPRVGDEHERADALDRRRELAELARVLRAVLVQAEQVEPRTRVGRDDARDRAQRLAQRGGPTRG